MRVNQEVAKEILYFFGCEVELANNGKEAVEAFLTGDYDTILMDCQMPEMDGFEATALIRQHEQDNASDHQIPIIALTANAVEGDSRRCLLAGMNDYLAKPFSQKDLFNLLLCWLPQSDETESVTSHHADYFFVDTDETDDSNDEIAIIEATVFEHHNGVVDLQVLDSIRSLQQAGGPDILAKMIDIFTSEAPHYIEQLKLAMSQSNTEGLCKAAHSLKSISGNLGALQLAQMAKDLETMGYSDTVSKAGELIVAIESSYADVALVLNQKRNKSTSSI
jgi:CheY-like chemotaxis protein